MGENNCKTHCLTSTSRCKKASASVLHLQSTMPSPGSYMSVDGPGSSQPVKQRLASISSLLLNLNEAKAKQGTTPGSSVRGVWITYAVWSAIAKQLKLQMAEVLEWEQMLMTSQQALADVCVEKDSLAEALRLCENEKQRQASTQQQRIKDLEEEVSQKEQAWTQNQQKLCQQADALIGEVTVKTDKQRELGEQIRVLGKELDAAHAARKEAEARAAEHKRRADYFEDKSSASLQDHDGLMKQVRELTVQLSEAQQQLGTQREALSARRQPSEQLLDECQRLRDDNRRLVALLGGTQEWKGLAKRLADQDHSLHYLPVHELLQYKGGVTSLYPALEDRPVQPKIKGLNPEEWSWVPAQAIEAVRDICTRVLSAGPVEPLLGLLMALNKIWREREARSLAAQHAEFESEMRELHRLYRQRAPYEAVVGKTRLADLKRQLRLQAAQAQHLADKASGSMKASADDNKVLLALGLDSVNTLSHQVKTLNKRTAKLRKKLADKTNTQPVCTSCLDNFLLQDAHAPSNNHQSGSNNLITIWDLLTGGTAVVNASSGPQAPEPMQPSQAMPPREHALPPGQQTCDIATYTLPAASVAQATSGGLRGSGTAAAASAGVATEPEGVINRADQGPLTVALTAKVTGHTEHRLSAQPGVYKAVGISGSSSTKHHQQSDLLFKAWDVKTGVLSRQGSVTRNGGLIPALH